MTAGMLRSSGSMESLLQDRPEVSMPMSVKRRRRRHTITEPALLESFQLGFPR